MTCESIFLFNTWQILANTLKLFWFFKKLFLRNLSLQQFAIQLERGPGGTGSVGSSVHNIVSEKPAKKKPTTQTKVTDYFNKSSQ